MSNTNGSVFTKDADGKFILRFRQIRTFIEVRYANKQRDYKVTSVLKMASS